MNKATTRPTTVPPSVHPTADVSCVSISAWTDTRANRCAYYAAKNLCTRTGAQGPGWKSWWTPYLTAARNSTTGVPVWKACCACGGGTTAVLPTATAHVSDDGSTRNATGGGSGDASTASVGIWTAVLVVAIVVVVTLVVRSRWVKPRQGSYTHLDEDGFGRAGDSSTGAGARRRGYDHDLTMDLMSIGPTLDDDDEDDLIFKSNRR